MPTGYRICLGARILTICDAFDAMVSDRVYRKGRAAEEAYTELRRCAGAQFDPELVERFIEGHAREPASRGAGIGAVPRQSALQIGLHLERLAAALDGGNATTIVAIASHLAATAEQEGVPEVAERARKVQQCTEDTRQELELSRLTLEPLEIYRETQRSHVQVGDEAPRRPRAELVETGTPAQSDAQVARPGTNSRRARTVRSRTRSPARAAVPTRGRTSPAGCGRWSTRPPRGNGVRCVPAETANRSAPPSGR